MDDLPLVPSATRSRKGKQESSQTAGQHTRYGFSFRPLVKRVQGAVSTADVVPVRGPDDTDVWLTEWQVAEDSLGVSINQQVDWVLVPMDQEWLNILFAGRKRVSFRLDTYADAVRKLGDPSWTHLSGHVIRIDQISVRHQPLRGPAVRREAVRAVGEAMEHSVRSVQQRRPHHGSIVGWIVRVRK